MRAWTRRIAAAALALGLATASHAARAVELVALPPRAPADLERIARGAAEWVRVRFAEAGFASADGFVLGAELPISRARSLPPPAQLAAAASPFGVERAWVVDLDADRGRATVQVGIADTATGAWSAAGRGEAALADLGTALAAAADAVVLQSGAAGQTAQVPTVAELWASGRAAELMANGALADAWRQLGTRDSAAATALRARLADLGRHEDMPAGEQARLAVSRGDAERARLLLRAQLGASREDPRLALAVAEAAEERGETDRALPLYDAALALDPASVPARQGRARILARLGRAEEAVLAIDGVEDPDPALLESLAAIPSLPPGARSQLHLRAAAAHERRFDAAQAQEEIARATQLDASVQGAAHRSSALLLTRMGRSADALAPAEQAIQLGAADATLYGALGQARFANGDAAGARDAYEKARRLAPDDAVALRGLGEVAASTGDTAAARELLGRALASSPADRRSRLLLAGLMRASGDLDGAAGLLNEQPGGPDADALREVAEIRVQQGDAQAAAETLEHAMELAPANPLVLGELAKLREASGDATGAETLRASARNLGAPDATATDAADLGRTESRTGEIAGGLGDLAKSFPQRIPGHDGPVGVVALLAPSFEVEPNARERILAPKRIALDRIGDEIAAALGARFEVVAPHEIPRELAAPEQARLRAFAEDEPTIARMNDALGTDAVFVARVRPPEPGENHDGDLRLEVRMLVGAEALRVRRFGNQTWIAGGIERFSEWNPVAWMLASLLLLCAVLPLLRGWGELVVSIQYASLGKGFFSIKISRTPSRAEVGETRKSAGGNRYLRKMRMMGRFERAMVGKETVFRWLPARRYYVTVHGLLQDPASDAVVGNYAAEQTVVIARGKTARLDFDFRAREAALEVSISKGGEPVASATVALRGKPESLRYARNGSTMLYVVPGAHRVLIATEDSVFEREVVFDDFAPRTVTLDVLDENARIFHDCPDAVEPYLTGDMLVAAEALERAGQDAAAANVRGDHYAATGDTEKAARAFERAGRFEEAASLLSHGNDAASAAALFEQAGNHVKAAQAFEAAGQHARAAGNYETAYRYEDAVECYRRVGDLEKVSDLLEKLARYYDAAQTAIETGDADRAIRNLQMIDLRDPDYVRASQLLGRIFLDRGELDLAVQKLDEAVTVGGGDSAPLEIVEQLARGLEQAGRHQAALDAWESIRSRDFHYPDAGSRIEALRQNVDADRETRATLAAGGTPPVESRYEILGEVGRGGMGVVFKARDKRLGRVVALKRLPDNLRNHPTAVRLFLREARAAAALNHRNIVTLFDAGQEGDQYFLTMELLEGFPLHEILAKRGRLSPRDAARLGAQTCAGLEYAHAQGVVHRDIKTSNLFFTKDRVLKIMDFGLAKMTEEVRRAATVIGGTPYYMAPEQAAGEEVDHRADQYALGVTLYELVTGDVPFKDGDVTYHHRHTPPPDPRSIATDLPAELAELILRLMAKQRDDRFAKTGDAGVILQKVAKSLSE